MPSDFDEVQEVPTPYPIGFGADVPPEVPKVVDNPPFREGDLVVLKSHQEGEDPVLTVAWVGYQQVVYGEEKVCCQVWYYKRGRIRWDTVPACALEAYKA